MESSQQRTMPRYFRWALSSGPSESEGRDEDGERAQRAVPAAKYLFVSIASRRFKNLCCALGDKNGEAAANQVGVKHLVAIFDS